MANSRAAAASRASRPRGRRRGGAGAGPAPAPRRPGPAARPPGPGRRSRRWRPRRSGAAAPTGPTRPAGPARSRPATGAAGAGAGPAPALLQLVELDLAQGDRDHGREVDHPGHGQLLTADGGPAHGRGPHRLGGGDGEAGRHAGAGVDLGRLAHRPGEAGDDLEQVAGDERPAERLLVPGQHRLLADEGHLVVQAQRIVGADLGPEAVLGVMMRSRLV